jgi:branched-chain amino acid transport system ATP-binding protein
VLSGGEQQMLTRKLHADGRSDLIIDEPTEALAPKIVELVGQYLQNPAKCAAFLVLLIEQKLTIAMTISDRCTGHGSWQHRVADGTPDCLRRDETTSESEAAHEKTQ